MSKPAGEEARGRQDRALWNRVHASLYRILGQHAAHQDAFTVREKWEGLGKRLPSEPTYGPAKSEGVTQLVTFFGDPIAPESVFLVDTSTSMRHRTTVTPDQDSSPLAHDELIDRVVDDFL